MIGRGCTPGFLRGEAVASIIDALHQHARGGSWHLVAAEEMDSHTTRLIFAVGMINPDDPRDDRQRVTVMVAEEYPAERARRLG